VTVLNGVSAPQNVHLSFTEAGRQAKIDWDANPEPDVTSYTVQERVGDEPWKTVGQAGAKITSFTRQLTTPGTYHYQVAAIRASGTDDAPVQSAWSGPSSEPKQIVVTEPARPATTSTSGPDAVAEPVVPGDPNPGPPAAGGPGAPVAAAGAPGGPPPADGSKTRYSSPGNLLTRVQPGAPGSVDSHGASPGRLVDRGAAPPAAPTTEPPDEPFSEQLPYKKPAAENRGSEGIAGTLVSLPRTITTDSRRDLAIPLAAGLLLFVFAMHALYLSRRSAPEDPSDVT
jgi:hypothetical protein